MRSMAGPATWCSPQGHFHYFENASDTEELAVLIAFNASSSEPEDECGRD